MTILVCTQKVDARDPVLGFFVSWLRALSAHADLIVLALEVGEYDLPKNVQVISLGKESGRSRLQYLWRFFSTIIRLRREYDGVFVHMNPEYVILGGPLFHLWKKKVLLWYTHKAVNLRLKLAEYFATKIFTASAESFRLPSEKVEIVGHGISPEAIQPRSLEQPHDTLELLFVGRISPAKDVETVIQAVSDIHRDMPEKKVQLGIIGEPATSTDVAYAKTVKKLVETLGCASTIRFVGSLSHTRLLSEYQHYDILLHTSRTGSIDKVVLEALAAGLFVASSSEAFASMSDAVISIPSGDHQALAQTIEKIWDSAILKRNEAGMALVRNRYSLEPLADRIVDYFRV